MKRDTAMFAADEDPAALFDEALDLADLEDDAVHADDDDEDFENDLRVLAAHRAANRAARRRLAR